MYSSNDIDMLSVGRWQGVNGGVTQLSSSSSSLHTVTDWTWSVTNFIYVRMHSWTKIADTIGIYNVAGKTLLWWLNNHKLQAYTTYWALSFVWRVCLNCSYTSKWHAKAICSRYRQREKLWYHWLKKLKNNRAARATRF